MKVLIFGVSSKSSVGYELGESLRSLGHKPVYASRSGTLGVACDINNPEAVLRVLKKESPSVIIHAAGVFSPARKLGQLAQWEHVQKHLAAKSYGALVLANAAVKTKGAKFFIALGGRELSSNKGFAAYTVGNGALWSLVQFVSAHTRLRAYYIDMPFVHGSTMGTLFNAKKSESVSIKDVARAVQKILKGGVKKGSRVIVGKKGGA